MKRGQGMRGFPLEIGSPGGILHQAIYTVAGNHHYVKPPMDHVDGPLTIIVRAWGGGGSGGVNSGSNSGGGGPGGFAERSFLYDDFPCVVPVVVGAGGAWVGATTNGNAGGNSSVNGTSVVATGGAGGIAGGAGGTGGTGQYDGVSIALAKAATGSGGAGSTAGSSGYFTPGGGGGSQAAGGTSVYGGAGGAGGPGAGQAGTAGTAPGGGGGAGNNAGSGAGGDGRVEIYIVAGRVHTDTTSFV